MLDDRLTAAVVLALLTLGRQLTTRLKRIGPASRIRRAVNCRLPLFVKNAEIRQKPFPRLTAQAGTAPNRIESSYHEEEKD